jgi:hypothetical protein
VFLHGRRTSKIINGRHGKYMKTETVNNACGIEMVIVPLDGNIFWANVESYIILPWTFSLTEQWEGNFIKEWEGFVKYRMGDEVRFIDNEGKAVEGINAYKLHSQVLTLDPPFAESSSMPLKHLYFLKEDGSLKNRLFKALDALNDKHVTSVAFNGDNDYSPKAIKRMGEIFQDWEKEKISNADPVYIQQVSLVCSRDYFVRHLPSVEPIIEPVFRPAYIPILPLEESRENRIRDILNDEQQLKSFLQSSLFYPAAGEDTRPIMLFKDKISNFVYSSYGMEQFEIHKFLKTIALGIHIHKLPLKKLFGMNWKELVRNHADIPKTLSFQVEGNDFFAVSCFDPEQQKELNIIYIPLEGTIAFRELYLKRHISPKVLSYINPGMDCDENFPRLLSSAILENTASLPEFILNDRDDLNDLLQINQKYKCVSSDFWGYDDGLADGELPDREMILQLYYLKT